MSAIINGAAEIPRRKPVLSSNVIHQIPKCSKPGAGSILDLSARDERRRLAGTLIQQIQTHPDGMRATRVAHRILEPVVVRDPALGKGGRDADRIESCGAEDHAGLSQAQSARGVHRKTKLDPVVG